MEAACARSKLHKKFENLSRPKGCSTSTSRVPWGPLVVEVDGHEFHDRTKDQAARDRRRDRDMIREGLRVVRFTGTEVVGQPEVCAAEVEVLLLRTAQDTFKLYTESERLHELVLAG